MYCHPITSGLHTSQHINIFKPITKQYPKSRELSNPWLLPAALDTCYLRLAILEYYDLTSHVHLRYMMQRGDSRPEHQSGVGDVVPVYVSTQANYRHFATIWTSKASAAEGAPLLSTVHLASGVTTVVAHMLVARPL